MDQTIQAVEIISFHKSLLLDELLDIIHSFIFAAIC